MIKKIFTIIGDIFIAILACFAIISVISVLKSNTDEGVIPGLGKYKFMAVLSDSMKPTFRVYDLIIAKEVSTGELKEGDIITFTSGDILVTHRIKKIEEQYNKKVFITKGDANNVDDTIKVEAGDIKAKYIGRIPYMGFVIAKIRGPIGIGILWCVFSFIIISEILIFIDSKSLDKLSRKDKDIKI